jgi:hypothetical protein
MFGGLDRLAKTALGARPDQAAGARAGGLTKNKKPGVVSWPFDQTDGQAKTIKFGAQ